MSQQNQDVYRKVGRGGAGNFYPSKKADDAARDIEAQETEAAASVPSVPSSKPATSSGMSRGGRGGAGNYVDSTTAAASTAQERDAAVNAASTTVKSNPGQHGSSGRGGAGNWRGNDAAAVPGDEDKGLGEEMERKVREAVNQGLKLPEKAHHALEKGKTSS